MNKSELLNSILKGSRNRLRENYFIKNHIDIYHEIILHCSKLADIQFKWKVWHWVNNEPNYILCKCGNRVSTNLNFIDGYRKFCSYKCASNDAELRERSKDTLLQKYGVTHYSQTNEYKNKVKNTNIERYGVDNFSKTDEYLLKSKATYKKKYGVDNYTKTDEYKIKSRQTCLDKYGIDSYTKTDEFKESIKNKSIYKDDKYRIGKFKISNDEYYIEYVDKQVSKFKCDNGLEHTFEISCDNYYGRKHSNNKLCTICNPISSLSSLKEESFYNFIFENYKGEVIRNYRDKFEIDVFLPELLIGFEFNGIYFHSDKFKEKDYHISKTNFFEKKSIKIIHIWEDDWIYKCAIVKSIIINLLGLTKNKIYARNCVVKEVSTLEAKNFFDKNHILGFVKSNIKIGLYYNNELVSCMSFDSFEGRKKMSDSEWNLNRFCNKLETNVIGGASKLFSFFTKTNNVERIISYADKDFSTGDLYYKLGFNLVGDNKSDYKYIIGDRRVHKSRYRKSRLKTELSESCFMQKNNINKIYDCGKLKFEKKFKI